MDNQWYDFLPKSESITLYEVLLSLFCLQEDEATSLTLLELPSTERNPSPQLECLPRPSTTPQPLVVWDVCTHITWRLMTRLDILCPKFRFPSKKMRPYRNSSSPYGRYRTHIPSLETQTQSSFVLGGLTRYTSRVKTKYSRNKERIVFTNALTVSLTPTCRKHYLLDLHLFLETTSKWKCSAALGSIPANLGNHMYSWCITDEEGALVFHSQTKQSLQLV